MKREHPSPNMSLPISIELHQQLCLASIKSAFAQEPWEIGAAAIREWMTRHNPDSFAMPETCGYQWKHLFLPNGTLLRTIFNGKNFHCLVEKDHIRYNGQKTSPSGFVNAVGGVRRNAWKAIWILFPKNHNSIGLAIARNIVASVQSAQNPNQKVMKAFVVQCIVKTPRRIVSPDSEQKRPTKNGLNEFPTKGIFR